MLNDSTYAPRLRSFEKDVGSSPRNLGAFQIPKRTPRPRGLLRRLAAEPRYVLVAAMFLATFAAYVERIGFSIAFTDLARGGGVDEGRKGAVLSAFYWGYALSQVGGG